VEQFLKKSKSFFKFYHN